MSLTPHLLTQSIGNANGLLNGYVNGNRLGGDNDGPPNPLKALGPSSPRSQPGLLAAALASRLQQNAAVPPNLADRRIAEEKDDDRRKEAEDKEKGDRVELSHFASEAIGEAVDNALRSPVNGATQQVFVSEDGLYQATIDLQVNKDGSFDLDISVGMAQAYGAGIQAFQPDEPADPSQELSRYGGGVSLASAQFIQETNLQYERYVATREWEAQIFYSSTERVAAGVSQSQGPDVGGKVLSVGSELSREFQMNISVSGEDLDRFLAQVEELSASEQPSDLASFLDAVGNVLTAAPDNVSDLLSATEALIARVGEQVSAAVNQFFGGIWDTFGPELEQLGFGSDFIEEMNGKAQQGLKDFLGVTNNFFENILGVSQNRTPEDIKADSDAQLLKESLELQKEDMEERQDEAEESRSVERAPFQLLA